jgi:hypothetical protein
MANENIKLVYTILCDDVRLEMGNKLSLMGVFQNIMVERLPVSLIKFAVVQHWRGEGTHVSEIRVLSPDKLTVVLAAQPTQIVLQEGGFADNVSFFVNATFPQAGTYWVQTLVDSNLFDELPIIITEMNAPPARTENGSNGGAADEEFPEIVN